MSARPMLFAETRLPARIGKYTVSGVIGTGAMGVVYRGHDPDIHRPVAIKTIRRPLPGEGDAAAAAQRFRTEAQAAGRLNHPNIVSVYEYGEAADGELFIAMECVEGPSLAALAERGTRLALADVIAVMLQLLDALHCAHAQRVWHNDIKPSNLLVTPEGRLKVTDFGIARVEAGEAMLHSAEWGSPGYMAPERYAGGALDQRVDLFACGVLLYELLTGRAPFRGNASAVMFEVLQHEPTPPSRLSQSTAPPSLDAVVAKALAKHPGDRFASAQAMRDALLDAAPAGRVRPLLSPPAVADLRGLCEPDGDSGMATEIVPRAVAAAAATVVGMPAATGTPLPLDALWLTQVDALLRPLLGPVSRFVVRDAARRCGGSAALLLRRVEQTLPEGERAAFAARAAQLLENVEPPRTQTGPPRTTGRQGSPASVPVLGQTPMRPELVDKAAHVLALQIGPIAMLLARRAAAGAQWREQFFCALADSAEASTDRKQLLEQLWRIE